MSTLLSATLPVVLLHLLWLLPRFPRLLTAGMVTLLTLATVLGLARLLPFLAGVSSALRALLVSPLALSSALLALLTALVALGELSTAPSLTCLVAALPVLRLALTVLTALVMAASALAALLAASLTSLTPLLVPGRPSTLVRPLTLLVSTAVTAHLLGLLPFLAGLLSALLLSSSPSLTPVTALLVSAAVIDTLLGGIEGRPSAPLRALSVPVLSIALLAALPPLSRVLLALLFESILSLIRVMLTHWFASVCLERQVVRKLGHRGPIGTTVIQGEVASAGERKVLGRGGAPVGELNDDKCVSIASKNN